MAIPTRFRTAALVLLLGAATSRVDAALIIDQQNTSYTYVASGYNSAMSAGQSFTPTLTGLDFAEWLRYGDGTSATAQVVIRNGVSGGDGFGGAVLGTSDVLALGALAGGQTETLHFLFSSVVSLVPSSTYFMEFKVLSGAVNLLYASGTNPYAGGMSFDQGKGVFTNNDLVFAEGLSTPAVPEPSSIALLGLGGAVLGGLAVRRKARA